MHVRASLQVIMDIIEVAEGKSVEAVLRQRRVLRSVARRTESIYSPSGRFRKESCVSEEEEALVQSELKLLEYDVCSVFHPNRKVLSKKRHKRTFCKYS